MPVTVTRTISVYVYRRWRGQTQFLTLLRSRGLALAGTWQAVHGKIEPVERAVDAALRELREEADLIPSHFFVAQYVETMFDPDAEEMLLVPVFAAEIEGDQPVAVSFEHERAEWCDVAETLRRFIWPPQREAVQRIVADFAEPTDGGALRDLCQIPVR